MKEKKEEKNQQLLLIEAGVNRYNREGHSKCKPAYAKLIGWRVELNVNKSKVYAEVEYYADSEGKQILFMQDGSFKRTILLLDMNPTWISPALIEQKIIKL